MNQLKECKNQTDLEKILEDRDIPILREGYWEITDSAQVTAYGRAQVRAYDSAQVRATPHVAITRHGSRTKVTGGVVIVKPILDNVDSWLEFYGISRTKTGFVTLFKAVDHEFKSGYGTCYAPGEKPEAPDFRTANAYGHGLHLCATPVNSLKYSPEATKFVACTVKVSDIVVIHEDGESDKIKVPRISKCVEVDIDGKKLS